ncbi:MAG: RIP metalloprotease RseP [Gammaproteobacteria bacterium]|nr:RIP metalloprotease RseP [Gammaproteobacteria bacterium]
MLSSIFYFIVTLFLLILVHEAGHFFVARWCGVKVLRFSFGFGKVLAAWHDKKGTEYTLSILPLGGYVKLLDDSEGLVPVQQRRQALNHQPLGIRVAVVLAGPLFNFLFAFLILWLVAVIGIKSFAPRIDHVRAGTVAAQAQLGSMQEIIAIDGKKINHWRDVHYTLMPLLGSKQSITVTEKSLRDATITEHRLSLASWHMDSQHPELLASLGIVPLFPKVPPVVDAVIPDSPAQTAGLEIGDEIIAVDDHPITDWLDLVAYVKARPGTRIVVKLRRQGQMQRLVAELRPAAEGAQSLLGVRTRRPEIPPDWLRWERSGPIDAIGQAFHQTLSLTTMTCTLIGRTLVGALSLDHISGPVGIAKAAGESAHTGLVYYLFFIALLSISIGVLNLLPIPLLDGGHLLYYLIEFVIRRPLSAGFKSGGAMIGIGLIILVTVIALVNDLQT